MTAGSREAIWRSMDRRKTWRFRNQAWMDGSKAGGDSLCICKREVPFDHDVTISDHYSPAFDACIGGAPFGFSSTDSFLVNTTLSHVTEHPLLFAKSCRLNISPPQPGIAGRRPLVERICFWSLTTLMSSLGGLGFIWAGPIPWHLEYALRDLGSMMAW